VILVDGTSKGAMPHSNDAIVRKKFDKSRLVVTREALLVLPENGSHLKAELPRPFSYLLHGFKTTPESFFSF
jgi:hypothetical protein